MAMEVYFMYQRDVPSTNGSIAPEKNIDGANLQSRQAELFCSQNTY